jgi:hypothetical protein
MIAAVLASLPAGEVLWVANAKDNASGFQIQVTYVTFSWSHSSLRRKAVLRPGRILCYHPAVSLTLALVFHFNQHIREHARLASQVCYRGLLRVLRARPEVKANIHLSGTLIHALGWLDPEPLELVREGLADGQFELLGSTYAQNVPYASDDWDNARQIELHRQVLQGVFGVTPTAFWISERCWRQSLVPLIAGAGYRMTLVEDHILEASGAPEAQVYNTRQGEHILALARDDERLKHHFNFAAWFGRSRGLHAYLDRTVQDDGRYLAYAEDAEAMGLWGYHQGVDPRQTWEQLGKALDELASRPDLQTGLLSQAPEPVAERSPIRDGCARWMDASLQQPGRPYHEDGYRDWFDFNARSPKLARTRRLYAQIREELRSRSERDPEKSEPGPGERALLQSALHTFLAHQYEFGCIGVGGGRYRGWEGARAALALARAADWAGEGRTGLWVEDVNGDGYPEACQSDGRWLAITTPLGGRLLYWFDLETGRQLVGNSLAVAPGEYQGDAALLPSRKCPRLWVPDGSGSQPVTEISESPPTRLGRFLPGWIWEGEVAPVSLAVREMRLGGEEDRLPAQRRGLVDELRLNGDEPMDPGKELLLSQDGEAVKYTRSLLDGLVLEKTYTLEPYGLWIVYRFSISSSAGAHISLATTSEVCLDYAAVLQHGRKALAFATDGGFPAVVGPLTGNGLRLESSRPWSRAIRRETLLALEIGFGFEFFLPANAEETFELRLSDFSPGEV